MFCVLGIFALRRGRGAKRGHLDDLVAEEHMSQTETPADQPAIAKQTAHLFGQRVGRDVEVLRPYAEQQIPHRTADEEALIASLLESVEYFQCVR